MTGRQFNQTSSPQTSALSPFEAVEREQLPNTAPTSAATNPFAQAMMNAGGHAEQAPPPTDTDTTHSNLDQRVQDEALQKQRQEQSHQRVQAETIERHTVFSKQDAAETAEINQLRLKLATMARTGQIGKHHPLTVELAKPVVHSHGQSSNDGHKSYFDKLEALLRKQVDLAKNSREWHAKAKAKARQKRGSQGGLEGGSRKEQQQAVHEMIDRQESSVATTGA